MMFDGVKGDASKAGSGPPESCDEGMMGVPVGELLREKRLRALKPDIKQRDAIPEVLHRLSCSWIGVGGVR